MDLLRTVIPKSDQLNFEDVQTQSITAVIKSIRAGTKEQPVFIDLVGYDGRPYKPSKSMRRVLIGGWGSDGHSWVGKTLTLMGDPSVKFGGVTVGGIKIYAMSDINADFSMMLSVSRGRRAEHRVKKIQNENHTKPEEVLSRFTEKASSMNSKELQDAFDWSTNALANYPSYHQELAQVYDARKKALMASV
ncbi:hypothetical protein QE197_11150 [Arsenophonus nasoniae]|uniref:Uncharacterized protein n=1 Tax=Arsenophonus nasoniae TaxID=638 RepID=A0A4V1BX06_9GAMM|nr:hypothetical protein [Arsenophonus nasoniae]QBY44023.1 hypothetical protein ArsFIN_25970 [Arsenophonus nasoniae]WGM04338.1 hypothetical protein QE258_11880 [Arsenophonus nasoniae]WGM09441.1 hypothetical protein QE197_11150 [Arsenophonus nasoniae]WGM14164.1 hypothetical protein QE193_11045 [Arsenophonus nasoniae]